MRERIVRNQGGALSIVYAGQTYVFEQGETLGVPEDAALYVEHNYFPRLQIVHPEAEAKEREQKFAADVVAELQNIAAAAAAAADADPEEPRPDPGVGDAPPAEPPAADPAPEAPTPE